MIFIKKNLQKVEFNGEFVLLRLFQVEEPSDSVCKNLHIII